MVDLYESENKLGFDKDGVFITDPFKSSCGRFLADPRKDYGLTSDQIEQIKLSLQAEKIRSSS